MTNWNNWVANCERFVRGVTKWPTALPSEDATEGAIHSSCETAPRLTPQEAGHIESELGRRFPAALRDFYLTGTAGMECKWQWEPVGEYADRVESILGERLACGGPSIIDARLQPQRDDSRQYILGTWTSKTKLTDGDRDLVHGLFPFMEVMNGDELLLGRCGKVYCFDHEFTGDTPLVLFSDSFEQFMRDWEYLHYLGPEGWFLTPFMQRHDDCCSRIDATLPSAASWRTLVHDVQAHALPR